MLNFALKEPGAIPTSIQGQIQALKQVVEGTTAASDDALSAAIREGAITNPSDLVTAILKTPSKYTQLKNVVGEDQLARVGGVQDMVMQSLVRNSMNKLDEASLQSGSWGQTLSKNLLKQNENGALDTILGKDVVSKLTTVAENAIKISDVPIKGYGGLAAATGAIAVASGMVSLNVATAGAALAGLIPIVAFSRALRNKQVLGLMTSPKLRAREYEAAIKAGANLPSLQSVKAGGPMTYYMNRLASIAASEAAIVTGSVVKDSINQNEGSKAVREYRRLGQTQPGSQEVGGTPITSSPPIVSKEAYEGLYPGNNNPLRQIEQNKLLGIGANQ